MTIEIWTLTILDGLEDGHPWVDKSISFASYREINTWILENLPAISGDQETVADRIYELNEGDSDKYTITKSSLAIATTME